MSVWTLFAHQLAFTLLAPALWQRISQPADRGETEAGTAERGALSQAQCAHPPLPPPQPWLFRAGRETIAPLARPQSSPRPSHTPLQLRKLRHSW